MRNHIYEVDWNYPDNDPTWRDLHQYIVVYNPQSKLGKIIEEVHFENDEERIKALDEELMKTFSIRDDEVAFYLGETKEPTEEEMKRNVLSDGDIIIKQVYAKYYEEDNQ